MSFPVRNMNVVAVTVLLEALGTAKTRYTVAPCDGKVVHISSVLDVTTDGDNVLTFGIDAVLMTGGTLTHASAATIGISKACVPTALNTVKRGQVLTAITDGGGTVGQCHVTFLIDQQG